MLFHRQSRGEARAGARRRYDHSGECGGQRRISREGAEADHAPGGRRRRRGSGRFPEGTPAIAETAGIIPQRQAPEAGRWAAEWTARRRRPVRGRAPDVFPGEAGRASPGGAQVLQESARPRARLQGGCRQGRVQGSVRCAAMERGLRHAGSRPLRADQRGVPDASELREVPAGVRVRPARPQLGAGEGRHRE